MSTEYERTVHSDKPTEDVPMSEREARASTWDEGPGHAENAWTATESETSARSEKQADDQVHASENVAESEHAKTTDYGTEPATATEYGAETAPQHDAEPDHVIATSGDADADQETTATADTEPDQTAVAANGAEQQKASLDDVGTPLFTDSEVDRLRTQWREVQGAFVDNPRDAVTQADKIVADVIYQLTTAYAERKRVLEERCAGLHEADTEELRQALRGYRGFFHRLLVIEQ
ncbi:hypothetical protein [Nocardia iowensis]|uniref:Uncharacterized protein n=1 Tax=Nocardia iowensis TaxID=204891 RepID=A0ABX8RGY8_NOCIO|nr:hypothetical protein [Nocardia iowensis]QXN88878.1 hypothetical protein KV110_25245 [Nocardia iowensis]